MKILEFGKKNYNILMYIGLFLLFFYSYNYTLSDKIYPNSIILFLNFFVSAICMIIANGPYINLENIKKWKKFIFVLILLLILILNRNGEIMHGHLGQPFCTVFSIFLIFILSFTDRWYKPAIKIILLFTLFHALFTIFCYFMPEFYLKNIMPLFPKYKNELLYQFNHHQIAGFTQHYSTNALYLSIGIIVSTFNIKLNFKTEKVKSIINIILYILIITALLLTGKRTQILFLILIIMLAYILKQRKNIKNAIKNIGLFALIFACFIFILSFIIPTIANSFIRIFNTIGNFGEFNTRIPLYKLAIDKFLEKPIFGWGWSNYRYVYHTVMNNKEREFMSAHCIYLQSLMEIGIAGSIVLYSNYLFLLIQSVKNILIAKKNIIIKYCYFFFAFHLYFLLEGLFGNSLYDISILIPYCTLVGLFIYIYYNQDKNTKKEE